MKNRSVILIADDDEDSILLLQNAFELAQVADTRRVVRNGKEVIDYLSGKGIYRDREDFPWPALMLLDLKMPVVDGFEVLQWWGEHRGGRELPIVVMSTSNQEGDILKAMAMGATAYQVKPGSFDYLVEVARALQERWLKPERLGTPAGFVRAPGRGKSAEPRSFGRRAVA